MSESVHGVVALWSRLYVETRRLRDRLESLARSPAPSASRPRDRRRARSRAPVWALPPSLPGPRFTRGPAPGAKVRHSEEYVVRFAVSQPASKTRSWRCMK